MNVTAERLKNLRKEKNISQDELANLFNIDRTTYLKYEKTGKVPTTKLISLANYFHVSSDYLLGLTNIPIPIDIYIQKNVDISFEEQELVFKYRQLPKDDKIRINTRIDVALENIEEKKKLEQEATKGA